MTKFRITILSALVSLFFTNTIFSQISFKDSGQLLGDSNSKGVTLGDLDGDGDLDAFVANFGNNKIWLNNGEGVFIESGQYFDSTNTYNIILLDIDNDSDLDAIDANQNQNVLWINNGKASFTKSSQMFGNYDTPHFDFGDLNNDGYLDLFITNFTLPGFTGFAPIEILFNDGTGRFVDSGQILQGFGSRDVELADFDGDGDLDAFITNHFEHINNIDLGNGNPPNQLYINDGKGNFTDSGQRIGNSVSDYVNGADVDNDGDIDLFVANSFSENYLWINDGKGNFTIGQKIESQARNICFSDIDKDADFDLIIIKSSGENSIWVNDGSGNFLKEFSFDTDSKNLGLAVGDLDNDTYPDIFLAVANKSETKNNNLVYYNRFNGYGYLRQTLPGNTPKIFAKGLISVDNKNSHALSISPDGKMIIVSRYPDRTSYYTIYQDGKWTELKQTPFTGKECSFSLDGTKIFYYRDFNLYYTKFEDNAWGEEVILSNEINRSEMVYYPCIVADGSLYFSENGKWDEARIKLSRLVDGVYQEPEDLGDLINNGGASHAWISADESYMLFNSPRKGSYTKNDIWISIKNLENKWGFPKNLGEEINFGADAILCPTVSPDGKYMFFTKLNQENRTGYVYWVSTEIIENFRNNE